MVTFLLRLLFLEPFCKRVGEARVFFVEQQEEQGKSKDKKIFSMAARGKIVRYLC